MGNQRKLVDRRVLHRAVRGGRKGRSGRTALCRPSMVKNDREGEFPRERRRSERNRGEFAGLGFAPLARPERAHSTGCRELFSGQGLRSGRRHGKQSRNRLRAPAPARYPHRGFRGGWHRVAGSGDGSGSLCLAAASQSCAASSADRQPVQEVVYSRKLIMQEAWPQQDGWTSLRVGEHGYVRRGRYDPGGNSRAQKNTPSLWGLISCLIRQKLRR